MWASRWSAAKQDPPLLVPEDACRRGCGRGGAGPAGVRSRRAISSPSSSGRVTVDVRAPAAEAAGDAAAGPRSTSSGMPLRSISSTANWSSASASSSKLASRSAATPIAATSAPECSTRISTRPRWSMCWWVTTISSRSSIEWPRSAELRGQLVERLAGVGPGVDQGQRLVLDQVAVDPPDRERGRDRAGGGSRPAPPARAPPRGSVVTPGSARGPRRGGAPCPRARPATRG